LSLTNNRIEEPTASALSLTNNRIEEPTASALSLTRRQVVQGAFEKAFYVRKLDANLLSKLSWPKFVLSFCGPAVMRTFSNIGNRLKIE
jgi:hypothetical protein